MRVNETERQPRSTSLMRGAALAGAAVLVASTAVRSALDPAQRPGPRSSAEEPGSVETSSAVPSSAPGLVLGAHLAPGTVLEAQEMALALGHDTDLDGLSNTQEHVLGTLPYAVDSDGDGYCDTEELARNSDPLWSGSVPQTISSSAGLTARGEDGFLRLVMCVHEPESQEGDALIRLGVSASGQVLPVPLDRLALAGEVTFADGSNGSSLTCIDVPIDPAFVHAHGFVSFFVASGSKATQHLESAGKIDIFSDGHTLYLQTTTSSILARRQVGQGGATIRRPIPVVIGPPPESNWVAGAVCFQRSEVIGVNGPRLLHQIVEADCVQGWDTFCAGNCSSAVGDTYETVDPWSLIGG